MRPEIFQDSLGYDGRVDTGRGGVMWFESEDGKWRMWISPEELAAIRERHRQQRLKEDAAWAPASTSPGPQSCRLGAQVTKGKVESGLVLDAVANELQRHPGITFVPIQRAMIDRGSDEPLRVEPRLLPTGLAELIFTRLEVTPTADVRELVEAGNKLSHYLGLWSGSDGCGDEPLNPYKRVAHEAQRDWRNLTTKHSEAA